MADPSWSTQDNRSLFASRGHGARSPDSVSAHIPNDPTVSLAHRGRKASHYAYQSAQTTSAPRSTEPVTTTFEQPAVSTPQTPVSQPMAPESTVPPLETSINTSDPEPSQTARDALHPHW
ncbi:hypothetical protein B0H10DRAFT_2431239 [Mycena sp. CBHHK59/15]|nr:hypothetical protein B0H10DRAFT_2431239 [Mycena sp. CBHHK59/15]